MAVSHSGLAPKHSVALPNSLHTLPFRLPNGFQEIINGTGLGESGGSFQVIYVHEQQNWRSLSDFLLLHLRAMSSCEADYVPEWRTRIEHVICIFHPFDIFATSSYYIEFLNYSVL